MTIEQRVQEEPDGGLGGQRARARIMAVDGDEVRAQRLPALAGDAQPPAYGEPAEAASRPAGRPGDVVREFPYGHAGIEVVHDGCVADIGEVGGVGEGADL